MTRDWRKSQFNQLLIAGAFGFVGWEIAGTAGFLVVIALTLAMLLSPLSRALDVCGSRQVKHVIDRMDIQENEVCQVSNAVVARLQIHSVQRGRP